MIYEPEQAIFSPGFGEKMKEQLSRRQDDIGMQEA